MFNRKKYDYDAIVIGGGSAGLTASGMAANFGAKTMLVEKDKLGGDCTWTGCIPSKTLLKAGKIAHQMRNAAKYGIANQEPDIDFGQVIDKVHQKQREMYEEADRPEIYEEMGIDVVEGKATFRDEHTIQIKSENSTETVSARYFFICTGSHPAIPPIPGVDTISYLTTHSLFNIEKLPDRFAIIGAGPVGTEMAQAFSRLGSKVTVFEVTERILSNDDPELASMLKNHLEGEGITYHMDANISKISEKGGGVAISLEGTANEITADKLLIAAGRSPNIESLNLNKAGVSYSADGISVDDKCRSSRSYIYACGDVTGLYQFSHMSEHTAKIAVTNALLKIPQKIDKDHVPWVTFADPELAHVGASERQLKSDGINYETYRFPFTKLDRAIAESETQGLIKIRAKKLSGKILGVDILGERAGELISEYALAMKNGITLRNIADTIHPYPTFGQGARRAADQWYIKNQSEWQVKLVKNLFGYRGEVPDLSDPDRIV